MGMFVGFKIVFCMTWAVHTLILVSSLTSTVLSAQSGVKAVTPNGCHGCIRVHRGVYMHTSFGMPSNLSNIGRKARLPHMKRSY